MSKERNGEGRRSFLRRAGVGAAAAGAAFGAGNAEAFAQSPSSASSFQPARHAEDDWFDQVPGKHRLFFDCTTPNGFGLGIRFASNFYDANRTAYSVEQNDLAVIISARHLATAFTYSDEMWAKYGKALAERAEFTDPKTKESPVVNVYRAAGYGALLSSTGVTLDAIGARGVRFAVCQLSTRANAGVIARQFGGNTNDIYNELVAHILPNARMVPAGIVAVNRAQERGYSLSYAG